MREIMFTSLLMAVKVSLRQGGPKIVHHVRLTGTRLRRRAGPGCQLGTSDLGAILGLEYQDSDPSRQCHDDAKPHWQAVRTAQ
jgi:hypothetical protein